MSEYSQEEKSMQNKKMVLIGAGIFLGILVGLTVINQLAEIILLLQIRN